MASAYVSGDPTKSLVKYANNNTNNDYSYYGMGCPNAWGTDGDGGSDIPCTTRVVKDGNNEDQKNGTYYSFQAASSGSGAETTTDNTNIPDTFCPLGWQMPYGGTSGDYYDKSKSWKYLFDEYDITYNTAHYDSAAKIKAAPFSYIYSGYFLWTTGRLYYQGGSGVWWAKTTATYERIYELGTWSSTVQLSGSDHRLRGYTIRCTSSSTARWQEHLQI